MAVFKIFIRGNLKGTGSPALTRMLVNMGRIPELLGDIGSVITNEIRRNLNNRLLRQRSGRLHDSWIWKVSSISSGWQLVISSNVVYAAIHNFGGWAGVGHHSKIKKTRYVDRAVVKKKAKIRRLSRSFITRLSVSTRR